MSRKKQAPIRRVAPDPIYNSIIVTKLINKIMWDGKKIKSQNIVYRAFDLIEEKTGEKAIDVFSRALEKITPILEVKTRRIGGANYQVPIEVSEKRKKTLSLRWLVNFARNRAEKTMEQCLAYEIIDAAKGVGGSIKKREDTHKMAESNRAFAHYRW
ncbi:MAG: 30S ribosomal protein S7 [Mycoplasma sp.]|nr:30S ribosomal protein S7 [Mycoplasma sp.]